MEMRKRPTALVIAEIFDHLDDSRDSDWFRHIAREMRASSWWGRVSKYETPMTVNGVIVR